MNVYITKCSDMKFSEGILFREYSVDTSCEIDWCIAVVKLSTVMCLNDCNVT